MIFYSLLILWYAYSLIWLPFYQAMDRTTIYKQVLLWAVYKVWYSACVWNFLKYNLTCYFKKQQRSILNNKTYMAAW